MHNDTNAMTEVALALAMAFFALMVLTLVSMGVPSATSDAAGDTAVNEAIAVEGAATNERALASSEQLIFYYDGQFFDSDLNALAPSLNIAGAVVLAVPRDLSLADLLEVRRRISSPNLSITTLDGDWQQALETRS